MITIKDIRSRSILDSRGNPTVETEILTRAGWVRASVPSGVSTGTHEAIELRDHKRAFLGMGVASAVKHVHALKKTLCSGAWNQESLDAFLLKIDGTKNKSRLGANTILSVSAAFAKASAQENNVPLWQYIQNEFGSRSVSLPIPAMNIINGGKHAGTPLQIQEYQILPTKAKSFSDALRIGSEIYHVLKTIIAQKYGKQATNVGDEGGFVPTMKTHTEPFDVICTAIEEAGYKKEITLGIDAAASEFYSNGTYTLDEDAMDSKELLDEYVEMTKTYPLRSIEDPFHENDFLHFAMLHKKLPKIQIVGDDLLCTNPARIKYAMHKKAVNCLLLKINQIGTISEAFEAAKLAKNARWRIMVSHRSGETTDDFIADLAVGMNAGQIKAGAPARGERVCKYNQLLRIEEQLGKNARYGK